MDLFEDQPRAHFVTRHADADPELGVSRAASDELDFDWLTPRRPGLDPATIAAFLAFLLERVVSEGLDGGFASCEEVVEGSLFLRVQLAA